MARLAVVVGGWHWPAHLYRALANQTPVPGWEYEFFSVAHRPPGYREEKEEIFKDTHNGKTLYALDRYIYDQDVSVAYLESLGWNYSLEDNTVGNFEFLNQWMRKHDWRDYDMVLNAHDDCFIRRQDLLHNVLSDKVTLFQKETRRGIDTVPARDRSWIWLENSTSPRYYHIRNTLTFFKPEFFEILGDDGFDVSNIKLRRVGEFNTPKSHNALSDWNACGRMLTNFIDQNKIHSKIKFLSPHYRVSPYCIEGERGLIHKRAWGGSYYLKGLRELGYEV